MIYTGGKQCGAHELLVAHGPFQLRATAAATEQPERMG